MSEYQAYQLKMEALLAEWPHRIELMAERAPTIVPAKRPVYDECLKKMRDAYEDSRRALAADQASGESERPEARKSLERAWSNLANAYEKALCQFEGVKN